MRKKIVALFCMLATLCACLCGTAFAAKKPSVELVTLQVMWGNNYAYAPTVYCRNNTNKTIKYIDWYATAYNRVGDPVPGVATKKLTSVGPTQPFEVVKNSGAQLNVVREITDECPFKYYRETGYFVSIGENDRLQKVYQDVYGNFFVQTEVNDIFSGTYLTESEIQNAMSDSWCKFDDIGWMSNVIDHISVDKAVITYMDGSTETVTNVNSKHRGMTLQNPPFAQQLAQYDAVYNYQDYLHFNPDLADIIGTNQKALFEHFISSGMKEGRQGSSNFNLDTYKANNPDLVAAFGNDNVKYYDHYITSGKAEGRIAK